MTLYFIPYEHPGIELPDGVFFCLLVEAPNEQAAKDAVKSRGLSTSDLRPVKTVKSEATAVT